MLAMSWLARAARLRQKVKVRTAKQVNRRRQRRHIRRVLGMKFLTGGGRCSSCDF